MMNLNNEISTDRVNAVLAKYNQVCGEITRYRNYEWQITAWVVGLLVGTAHLATHELDCLTCRMQFAAILVVLAVLIGGCCHLGFVHTRLTQMRGLCNHLEEMLGFHLEGVYEVDKTAVPPAWRSGPVQWRIGIWHVLSWVALMAIAAGFAVYAIAMHPTV